MEKLAEVDRTNCSGSGRSSPSSSRVRATTSAVARSPTMASTGSIGTTRPIRKVMSTRPNRVMGTLASAAASPRNRRTTRLP